MRRLPLLCLSLVLVLQMHAQTDHHLPLGRPDDPPPGEVRLPNGKLQQDEILKSDHQRSLDDARELVALAQSLQQELEKSGSQVLPVAGVRKTEEIERLAKRIRGRLRRS